MKALTTFAVLLAWLGGAMMALSIEEIVRHTSAPPTVRAKVLENGTMTMCHLDEAQQKNTRHGDTIWLNLSTHKIDELDTAAMMAVIE